MFVRIGWVNVSKALNSVWHTLYAPGTFAIIIFWGQIACRINLCQAPSAEVGAQENC